MEKILQKLENMKLIEISKLILIIFALLIGLFIGCATQDQAVKKGYLIFDKKTAIIEGISVFAFGPNSMQMGTGGWSWNLNLMEVNYPECFKEDESGHFCGYLSPLMCVQNKVQEEGKWR